MDDLVVHQTSRPWGLNISINDDPSDGSLVWQSRQGPQTARLSTVQKRDPLTRPAVFPYICDRVHESLLRDIVNQFKT